MEALLEPRTACQPAQATLMVVPGAVPVTLSNKLQPWHPTTIDHPLTSGCLRLLRLPPLCKGGDVVAVPNTEIKKLALRSGGRCSFPECRMPLTTVDPQSGEVVVLGHIAHIVAQKDRGPRGDPNLSSAERHRYNNLILLCTNHHQLVDNPASYEKWTKERLVALREDHEHWVESRLDPVPEQQLRPFREDTLFTTLLPVELMPRYIYSAETSYRRHQELPDVQAGHSPLMMICALHDRRLWAFQNLRQPHGPFSECVETYSTERHELAELAVNPDGHRLIQQLLNRSLNKLTGRRGLMFDKEKYRYYFLPDEQGTPRTEQYLSLTGRDSSLSVVWQPVIKATGQPRNYWLHRAVSLQFIQIDTDAWCLSLRPGFSITADGFESHPSKKIGSKITKKRSRMYNANILAELQFWRHYLSDGLPRIVMKFSDQQAIHISSTLVAGAVEWPGIPPEFDISYSNVRYLDNLFTIAEVIEQEKASQDDDWMEEWTELDSDEVEDD